MVTQTQTPKKIEEQRFEFVLYINKNIICQRYFSIKDFNEKSLKSLELKDLMDTLVGMNNGQFGSLGIIPMNFKKKSIDFLWKNYNPYAPARTDNFKNIFDKEDIFDFEIKVDRNVVSKGTFSGNFFPPSVRYQVDIKDIIPQIITEIKYTLSQKKYTTKYDKVEL